MRASEHASMPVVVHSRITSRAEDVSVSLAQNERHEPRIYLGHYSYSYSYSYSYPSNSAEVLLPLTEVAGGPDRSACPAAGRPVVLCSGIRIPPPGRPERRSS